MDAHGRLPAGSNATIERNIRALMERFGLSLDEWHAWADMAVNK